MKIGRVLTGVVFAAAVFAANAEERFFVGCNYWASHAGMMMWRDWDGARVEGDLDRCRAEGMTMLRVFPLWPDFQPLTAEYGGGGAFRGWTQAGGPLRNDAAVDDVMMKRFRFLCDAAAKRGVRLVVGLVTGWMSGRLFVPPALEGRNVLVDADAVMWQTRFVRRFVREMKDHPAIYAWDLGNECNCMGGANVAQAWNWMNTLASAIRLEDATRPVVSGMHGCPTASGAPWSLRTQGELVDVTTTHPYPLWTPDCNREEFNTLRDELHAAAESALYRDLSGRPCFPEEAGSMGPGITSEERAAAAMRVMLFTSWAEGSPGFLWWCAFDQSKLAFAPYDWTAIERELGLFKPDGAPKPTARTMKEFSDFVSELLPFARLPAKRYDAVVLVSTREDSWRNAFGAYLLAAQAGFSVRFADAERPLPESSLYILPSGAGYESYTGTAWNRLREKVRTGATALVTLGNGAVLSELLETAGVRTESHFAGASSQTFAFGCWPDRRITLASSHTRRIEPVSARVRAEDDAGRPAVTVNDFGKGKVVFVNAALEANAVANGGCWTGETMNPLFLVYRAAAAEAGLAPVVQKPETAPELVLSEHPDGKGGTYVVAVNASPKTITCKLKIDGKVEYVWSGKMRGGELTLPPNDGCVVLIRSH